MSLLRVENLRTWFDSDRGPIRAVDGVDLSIEAGRTLGVVGESGSGKSVTALSVLRLVDPPGHSAPESRILFDGRDLAQLDEKAMERVRGASISMIFQEPMTSLNPAYTVGDQIMEVLRRHRGMSKAEAREHTIEMLRRVRIPSPEQRVDDYPHKLSGGMRQRVMIAMALACNPKLLIADEPTTALDVTIQAQILDLMRKLRDETGTAIMLITHDLGVIAELARTVVVMYAGRIVEKVAVGDLFADPQHPYTVGLLGSIPKLAADEPRLATIEGAVPNPTALPPGCKFHPRCPFAVERCRREEPPLLEVKPGHLAACWRSPLEEHVL